MRNAIKPSVFALGFVASVVASSPSAALNLSADFCTSDDNCAIIQIENQSTTTVKKVNITQEKTDGACSKKSETISQNLAGGMGGTGEVVYARFKMKCQYKVKFVTTSGCVGDKTAHFKTGNFPDKYNAVKLKEGCGTLRTKKTVVDVGGDSSGILAQ